MPKAITFTPCELNIMETALQVRYEQLLRASRSEPDKQVAEIRELQASAVRDLSSRIRSQDAVAAKVTI